jgi:hypothetical protein
MKKLSSNFQIVEIKKFIKQHTVGAIHELPLLAWGENCRE